MQKFILENNGNTHRDSQPSTLTEHAIKKHTCQQIILKIVSKTSIVLHVPIFWLGNDPLKGCLQIFKANDPRKCVKEMFKANAQKQMFKFFG